MRNQQLPLPALEPGGNAPGTVARTGGRNRRNGGRKRWEKSWGHLAEKRQEQ